ncbi:sulfite reductase beta subunit-like hemoprotein [Kineococcus aurantiacus]|uniref:assimilatory sulfite reductase (ferredoxin) n=1 Tax=Kineococcus aurantiacus TaxID=37633 RepID=A0A7Y9DJR2_9ACTN|nr:sulfite reductase beta subunit-like hemoprotein [Kineococcus aurantiacus]
MHEIDDVSLVGVEHPELGPGYDLWVGGGLSTNPRLAERLGAFVRPEQAADVWHGVVRIFRDHGYRRLRHRARLEFLLADRGPVRFREVLERDHLGYALADGPPAPAPTGAGDHVGVHEQKDGLRHVGATPVADRVSADVLTGLADAAEAVGSRRVRLTPQQEVLVLDVPPGRVGQLTAQLDRIGLSTAPSPFRRTTTACTGIECCELAIVETKRTAAEAVSDLECRLAEREEEETFAQWAHRADEAALR